MSIYTKFKAVYERLQMLEETLGDLDPVTEIADLEARIEALEKVNETKVSLIRVEPNMSKFQFTQADLDAAVNKVLKDSLTGKLKYSQATLDVAVAEAKADGKRFSNRPCFTPREHNMLKKAAVEAERERCAKIVVDEFQPLSSEGPHAVCQRIIDEIEAGE